MTKTRFQSCTVLRRKLVRSGTLNVNTGESSLDAGQWVTEACGTPLFSDSECTSGICKSCASGWTHPENYPVADASNPFTARRVSPTRIDLYRNSLPVAAIIRAESYASGSLELVWRVRSFAQNGNSRRGNTDAVRATKSALGTAAGNAVAALLKSEG